MSGPFSQNKSHEASIEAAAENFRLRQVLAEVAGVLRERATDTRRNYWFNAGLRAAADELEAQVIAILDRVRDARGDDELRAENKRLRELYANQANIKARGWTIDHLMECEESLRMAEQRVAELEAARSPQDGNHEETNDERRP